MIRKLARAIIRIFFRQVVLEGHDRLPEKGPVIFTPNHPNGLIDPLFLFFLSPTFRIRFVAKEPLFRYPLLGRILRSIGAIPVIRRMDADDEIDYTAFFSACVVSLVSGESIAIFPEGTSLPQAYLAPLKTGPARLFFMTRAKGTTPSIVPVGLNYNRGKIFRSDVYVSIGSPLNTSKYEQQFTREPSAAILGLTEEIGRGLQDNLVQAETFRDKELMILLEKFYADEEKEDAHKSRFLRLKAFESGLKRLRSAYPTQIDRIRKWLERYRRLQKEFGSGVIYANPNISLKDFALALLGLFPALLGWVFNLLPYYICDGLIRVSRRDESDAATFKVIFSIFLFPILYILEFLILARFAGWPIAFLFLALIIPISYFTLNFFEWLGALFAGRSFRFGSQTKRRVLNQLDRLKQRIMGEMEWLANRPELLKPDSGTPEKL